MQRPKQKRYWAGKAPDWVKEEDDAAPAPAAAAAAPAPAAMPPPAAAALDPRLARLTQRQGSASERRGPTEAVVVQRRRHRSPPPEEEEEEGRHERRAAAGASAEPQRAPPAAGDDDEEAEDEEAIAARRAAIRARQLAAAAEAAAASEEDEEEDSSEYTTDDESDDDGAPVMLKPAFVPKTERETLAEREAALAAAEQTTRQEAEALEQRKRQTQEMLVHAQLHEAQQEAPADEGDLDTDDEKDEVAQYEAWRERELLRIARDRQLRQAGTKAEADAQAAAAGGAGGAPALQPKKKWKFLQKYWHKGAFFQGDDEEGVLGGILQRDYDAPTGEDRFDKEMLPKIMQVRNFGRRGRTKWTHLLAEDTTMQQAADYAAPAAGPRQPSQQVQDFSKPSQEAAVVRPACVARHATGAGGMALRLLAGGGSLGDHVLSNDGALLLVACVDSVLAYATATGEQAFRLQHAAPVTALCLQPGDDSRLLTGSKDGQLTLWDLTTGTAEKQWSLGSPVESLVTSRTGDAAYVSCHWRQQQAGRLFTYDLATGAEAVGGRAKVSTARRLVASPCGQLLATVDRHTALVWQEGTFPQAPLALTHTKALTCAALSHGGDILAVGDVTGRIVLYHGARTAVEAKAASRGAPEAAGSGAEADAAAAAMHVPRATVHWHAEPVRCLSFSADGTYLLSGGHEGVLVVWDISSGRRTYLPRLGGCLRSISSCGNDPSRVAVSLDDNVVRLVDLASMHVQSSIRGICSGPAARAASYMAIQPGAGNLALLGSAGSLQFYDFLRDTHIDRLQLSYLGQARAAATSHPEAAAMLKTTHALFGSNAEVLITAEQTVDVGGVVSVVKRWLRSEVPSYGRSYTLAAMDDNPHRINDSLSALALHPNGQLVAAALGSGGVQLLDTSGSAINASYVQAFQGTAVTSLAFSPDGTILAAGSSASSPVLLVECASQQVLAVLPPVAEAAAPVRMAFLAGGLHLAVQWEGGVGVHDLVRGRLCWASQLPTALLATSAQSCRLAVGMPGGSLIELDVEGRVIGGQGVLHGLGVQAAEFYSSPHATPGKGSAAPALLVLNDARQYAACLPLPPVPSQRVAVRGAASKQAPASGAAQANGQPAAPVAAGLASAAAGLELTASHLLPPATELCEHGLEKLLLL